MVGSTHLMGGLAVGVAMVLFPIQSALMTLPDRTNPAQCLAVIAISAIAALLPDIDVATSKVGRKVKPIAYGAQLIAGHRGAFHAPLLYLLAYVVGVAATPRWALLWSAGFVGVLSHLILDSFNPAGIPWLYPFSKRKFHFGNIRTGSIFDGVLRLLLIGGIGWMLLSQLL